MPQPFQYIPLSIIEPIQLSNLAQSGALINNTPVWDGMQWVRSNPMAAFQAGVYLGRVSELNVTGAATATVTGGNRMNINVNTSGVTIQGSPISTLVMGLGMQANISGATAFLSAPGVGASYTHPSYNSFAFEPNVSGSQITLPAIYTDSIGSVSNIFQRVFILPSGTGGVFVNGTGPYTSIQTGTGLTASGNVISAAASGATTLTHAGFGSPLFTGFQPNYTMKGLRSLSSGLTISDTGSTLDFTLTGGGAGGVNVWSNGNSIGVVQNINFVGFGSIFNGGNLAVVNAPPSSGGGGVNVNFSGPFTNLTFAGAGVSVVGSTITIPGASGGSAGIAILNNSVFFMNAVTTLDIWGGTLQNIAPGFARLVLPSGAGGGITGIQINNAGNYPNINFFGSGVSVSGNNVTIFGASSGLTGITANGLVISTNTVQLNLANFSSPGAMPALNGSTISYLAGDGFWRTIPSGGGLPSGISGDILWHNGTTWARDSGMMVDNQSAFFGGYRLAARGASPTYGLSFTVGSTYLKSSSHTNILAEADLRLGGVLAIEFTGGESRFKTTRMGFFNMAPVTKPTVVFGSLESLMFALSGLGLIHIQF